MPIRFLINIVVVVSSFIISIGIMNINILRYSLFGIAGGQEVDLTFVNFIIYPLTMIASKKICRIFSKYYV